ncbi:MAG: hypothetical protein RSD46_04180 [Oscillospiraceae bacterium]
MNPGGGGYLVLPLIHIVEEKLQSRRLNVLLQLFHHAHEEHIAGAPQYHRHIVGGFLFEMSGGIVGDIPLLLHHRQHFFSGLHPHVRPAVHHPGYGADSHPGKGRNLFDCQLFIHFFSP